MPWLAFAVKGKLDYISGEKTVEIGTKFTTDKGVGKFKVDTTKNLYFSWRRKLLKNHDVSLISSWKIPFDYMQVFNN